MRQTTFAKPATAAATEAEKPSMVEDDPKRLEAGFKNKDQRNPAMACPKDASHVPILFRSKTGANEGRLWWKCQSCVGRDGKLGQLIGLDAELEPSGRKLVDELEEKNSSAKRKKPEQVLAESAAGAIVAHGRGLDWVALHDRVNEIQRQNVEINVKLDAVIEQLKRSRSSSERKPDLVTEPVPAGFISQLRAEGHSVSVHDGGAIIRLAEPGATVRVIDHGSLGGPVAVAGTDREPAPTHGAGPVQRDAL